MNLFCENLSVGTVMSRVEVEGSTLRQVESPILVDTSLYAPRVGRGVVVNVIKSSQSPKIRTFGTLVGRCGKNTLVERGGFKAVRTLPGMKANVGRTEFLRMLPDKRMETKVKNWIDFGHAALRSTVPLKEFGDREISVAGKDMETWIADLYKVSNGMVATMEREKAKGKEKFNLFNPVLDENELADCFYHLYTACEKDKTLLVQKECEKLKFSACLFYLVKIEGFGGERLTQGRFYEFIKAKVFTELDQNVRTFNNRLTELEFLLEAVKDPEAYRTNAGFKYFRNMMNKFRNADFYKNLRKLRGCVSLFL
ncbi:MAG: hypothetical protein IJ467_05840 [Bacteroidaceae bacterium]|nr:hypothetical protein [Bacteroidaceae bacterium]